MAQAEGDTAEVPTDDEGDCIDCGDRAATSSGVTIIDGEFLTDQPLCYRCHLRPLATQVDKALRPFPTVSPSQRRDIYCDIVAEGVQTERSALEWVLRSNNINRPVRIAVCERVLHGAL